MKISAIREFDSKTMGEKLALTRQEIAKERALISSGHKPEKPGKLWNAKKDLARMLTVLREREIGIERREKKKTAAKKAGTGRQEKEKSAREKQTLKKKGVQNKK